MAGSPSKPVFDAILTADASVVDCRELVTLPAEDQERACLAAMAAGVQVIIGGLLPRDWVGHRSGRPDLLIRVEGKDTPRYQPAQVKAHRVADGRGEESPLLCSTLTEPLRRRELPTYRFRWQWRLNDVLQLAHYWRLLEQTGFAADRACAAILGTDDYPELGRALTWIDLDEPRLPTSPRLPSLEGVLVSGLTRYDQEHQIRVQIAEEARALGVDDPRTLHPIVNRECVYCQWWDTCRTELDDDDLSLKISKSPLDVHEIAVLRSLGVATVTELAGTDLEQLLPRYLPQVTHRFGAEERLRLAHRRSLLLARGIDFDRVSEGPISLPSAPLEIDIDVETSGSDRVYLWGFLVSDSRDGRSYYRDFSSFTDLDDEAEAALAVAAMSWLRDLIGDSPALVFHYSDYELVRLHRLAAASNHPTLAWAEEFARAGFVDLFAVIRANFFGTQGLGLKAVASKAAGFAWRDESPGGLNSQAWFAEAVGATTPELREAARRRVLEYNEDDVRATWHVRGWLRSQA
ncbi:MAG: TM0106 family RecB-like putative nuclease [Micropruina sp.]|nr:TM0106 family RecB-like putative nuclease [Micropruina sp.]